LPRDYLVIRDRMNDVVALTNIQVGTSAQIVSIESDELRANLLEMGLTTGSKIEVLYVAPFGDPIAVEIQGFVLSLRTSEANLVKVIAQKE